LSKFVTKADFIKTNKFTQLIVAVAIDSFNESNLHPNITFSSVVGDEEEFFLHALVTKMGQYHHKSLNKSNHIANHTNNNSPRYYLYVDATHDSEDDLQNHEIQQKDIEIWFDKKSFESNVEPLYKQGDATCFTFIQFDGSTRVDSTIYEQLPTKHQIFQLSNQFFRDYYEHYGDDVEPVPPEQEAKFDRIEKPQKIRGAILACISYDKHKFMIEQSSTYGLPGLQIRVTWKKWGAPEELLILYVQRPCYGIGAPNQQDIFSGHERRKYYQFTNIKFRSNVYSKYLETLSIARKVIEYSQNPSSSNVFSKLSFEILVLIFKLLNPVDIIAFGCASRECYHFANNETVWKDVCLRYFMPSYLKNYDLTETNETWKELYFNHQNFLRLVVQPAVDGSKTEYLFLELKIGNYYKIVKANYNIIGLVFLRFGFN